jgi:hypothetical protein
VQPLGFQALTVKVNSLADRIITDIVVFEPFGPGDTPDPPPRRTQTRALWDTGASKSVIKPQVAKDLQLTPVGTANLSHGGGTSQRPTYIVTFGLPNQVLIAGSLVSEVPDNGDFGAIVGMDVITLGDFSITNVNGQTWMSFRTPSCVAIDYVEEANQLHRSAFPRVGRNDPCPCGKTNQAGKPIKYKHCHGK